MHVKIPKKKGIYEDTPLTAIAFFLGSPRNWNFNQWTQKEILQFNSSLNSCPNINTDTIVAHGCYLINPSSIREDVVNKSKIRFINEIKCCDTLNIGNYVFHPGVNKDTQKSLQKTVDLINLGLNESKHVNILVENMTKSNTLCQTWQEIDWVIKHCNNKRVGVCIDTAHCWGAGEKKGMFMDTLLNDFNNIIGIKHLKAVHINDSKVSYGSNKDRHEDIFKGKIPKKFWKSFIFDKRLETIPSILETPSNCHSDLYNYITNNE